jgi:hypothetical protein
LANEVWPTARVSELALGKRGRYFGVARGGLQMDEQMKRFEEDMDWTHWMPLTAAKLVLVLVKN